MASTTVEYVVKDGSDAPTVSHVNMDEKYGLKPSKPSALAHEEEAQREWDSMSPEEKEKVLKTFRDNQIKNLEQIEASVKETEETQNRIKKTRVSESLKNAARAAKDAVNNKLTPEAIEDIEKAQADLNGYSDEQVDALLQTIADSIKMLNAAVSIYRSLVTCDFEHSRKPSARAKRYKRRMKKSQKIRSYRDVVVPREVFKTLQEFADKGELKKGETSLIDPEEMLNLAPKKVGGQTVYVIHTEIPKRSTFRPPPGEEFPERRARQLFSPANLIAADIGPCITKRERENYLRTSPMLDGKLNRKAAIERVRKLYRASLLARIDAMNIYDTIRVCTMEQLIAYSVELLLDMQKVELFGRAVLTDLSMHNLWTQHTYAEAGAAIAKSYFQHNELLKQLRMLLESVTADKTDNSRVTLSSSLVAAIQLIECFTQSSECLLRLNPPDLGTTDGVETQWFDPSQNTNKMSKTIGAFTLRWTVKNLTAVAVKFKPIVKMVAPANKMTRFVEITVTRAFYKVKDPSNALADKLSCEVKTFLWYMGDESQLALIRDDPAIAETLITIEQLFELVGSTLFALCDRIVGL